MTPSQAEQVLNDFFNKELAPKYSQWYLEDLKIDISNYLSTLPTPVDGGDEILLMDLEAVADNQPTDEARDIIHKAIARLSGGNETGEAGSEFHREVCPNCNYLIRPIASTPSSVLPESSAGIENELLDTLRTKWQEHIAKYYNKDSDAQKPMRNEIINEYHALILKYANISYANKRTSTKLPDDRKGDGKTAKQIFDRWYESYRNIENMPPIPLEARSVIFRAMKEYAEQQSSNPPAGEVSEEEIREILNEYKKFSNERFANHIGVYPWVTTREEFIKKWMQQQLKTK